MDRLISLEPSNVVPIRIEPGEKCQGKLTLRNVMHTMPVAFQLKVVNKVAYTVRPQTGIIPPLTTVIVEITYDIPTNSNLPESYPYCDDSFLLHSVVVPAAKTASMSDSVPSDWFTTRKKQVFVDSGIKVMFVGSMVLARLVTSGSIDEVRDVLEKSDPSWKAVDSVDSEGRSLLHLAVSHGRADLVQVLLEYKPDVDARSTRTRLGSTPLEVAVTSGESLIVELLLANQATIDRLDPSTWGPIHLAAGGGHVDILRLLLIKGAKVDALTKDGNTALHLAVEKQSRACARLLLTNGARFDICNICNSSAGETPLHIAAALGDENMVNLLIQNGANKNIQNRDKKTAYDVAVEHGHTKLFDVLGLADILCVATRKGDVRTIKRVLETGVTINGPDQNGWTVLHRASFKGRADIVRILIKKGVDIDARDEDGYTPLHCAVESGHVDVIELLVKKGADVSARTNKGATAMDIAKSLNNVGITRILIDWSKNGTPMRNRTGRGLAIRGGFDQPAAPLTVN